MATTTVTRTLQATLVPPTTHKETSLQHTLDTYRRALQDSFQAECDTKTAVNEVVTPYDLSSYAKDALKNYVPDLVDDADELDDAHPVRYTERGLTLDHDPEREHSFCWRVPKAQSADGSSFWIPLRISPAQESLWERLFDGEIDPNQFRLQRDGESWSLHVGVDIAVPEPAYDSESDGVTAVGFDIGEAHLLAGCACTNGSPTDPLLINGGRARQLRKEMFTTLTRLQERDAAQWRIDERFNHYQNALTDIVEKASRRAIDYAQQFDKPVIVLERLDSIREGLDYGKWMNRRLHNWAFRRVQDAIERKAAEAGIPIEYVHPHHTSQTCHACNHIGYRNSDEFRCTNDECWVTEYHADINAAVNIAERLDPWGESLSLKPAGDDIPRDGRTCDSATTPTKQSQSQQMTLGSYAESEPTASD
jgi:putative transposase